jgi:hypothetical protein
LYHTSPERPCEIRKRLEAVAPDRRPLRVLLSLLPAGAVLPGLAIALGGYGASPSASTRKKMA